MNLEVGMPVIMEDPEGLEGHHVFKGQEGTVNCVVNFEGEDFIYFMPDAQLKSYVIKGDRVSINYEKLEKKNVDTTD